MATDSETQMSPCNKKNKKLRKPKRNHLAESYELEEEQKVFSEVNAPPCDVFDFGGKDDKTHNNKNKGKRNREAIESGRIEDHVSVNKYEPSKNQFLSTRPPV